MAEPNSKMIAWFKKLGFAGFMFFFLKGMGWIVIFALVYFFGEEILPEGCRKLL